MADQGKKLGKIAVVTGAAMGIGQAYAKRLAEDGADIAIADIVPATETEDIVRGLGRKVKTMHCDVTSESDVKAFAAFVQQEFGRCDILINNAGIYPYTSFDDMTFEQWRHVLSVDLDGPFLVCKYIVPMMRRQKYGRIMNVCSAECWTIAQNNLHYISAKMGVLGLTRALANEVGDDNIIVNAIAPGITDTKTVQRDAPQYLTSLPKLQVIHRPGHPVDMANVMSFLTSDDAQFMTGQVLTNDGGWARL